MIWTDGRIIPAEDLRIDVRDETFQHGIGLFETLRTWNGHPTLLGRHLRRMRRSARELELNLEDGQLPDEHAVLELIEANRATATDLGGDVRIRITMTAGSPAAKACLKRSAVWVTAGAAATFGPRRGAAITRTIQVTNDDPLVRHKTLNYWRMRIEHNRTLREEADEVLTVTPDGLLCQGTRTNVFLVKGGRLITPGTGGPLLPGIMRSVVLDRAPRSGLEVTERSVRLDELSDADEAFLTNSGQGIVPIRRLLSWERAAPGPATHRLWTEIRSWLESGERTS